jgi:TonB-dependent starch-binding outer membrane protein SusC
MTRRTLLLALLVLVTAATGVAAQSTTDILTGRVTGPSGEPISGASVRATAMESGIQRGTLTNARGGFLFTGVPAGERQVRVVSLGYRSEVQTVQVPPGGTVALEFRLAVSAIALDEVVVTGPVGGVERRAIGNVVSVVRAAEVVEIASIPNLQSLINARAPGVVITPVASTQSIPLITIASSSNQ